MLTFQQYRVFANDKQNFKAMKNIYNITEYLPVRYDATLKQQQDRDMCFNFKDGILSTTVKDAFLKKVDEITNGKKTGWTICFIPASTSDKTKRRFSKLAAAFREAGYSVKENAIFNEYDTEAGHINGKSNNPISSFGFDRNAVNGQKVILIDDIITRGTTFNMTADKLEALGASSVSGLFLAKTINPDWGSRSAYYEDDYEPDYDDYDDYETYENYHGSYAQDVEGWSDQDIDDAFDGDPEAYWNID